MKSRVIQIEEFSPPSDVLHLSPDGWRYEKPDKMTIRVNIPLKDFVEQVVVQHSNLLGEGELVFALFNTTGIPSTHHFRATLDYIGHVIFIPELALDPS